MKKLLSLIMSFIMCLAIAMPTFAIENDTANSNAVIVESVIDIPVGEKTEATFVCDAVASPKLTLKTRTHAVANMHDNGTNGDAVKNDGTFSATVTLNSNERRTDTYYAYDGDRVVAEYTVNYYNELTDADFEVKNNVTAKVNEIAQVNELKSAEGRFSAIYDYLNNCSDIDSVERTAGSITYTTQAGITSVYTELAKDTKGSAQEYTAVSTQTGEMMPLADSDLLSYTNPNALVMRPFRHSNTDTGSGFNSDIYEDSARRIMAKTKGQMFLFDDESATPARLAEYLDKVGFLFIDSHGTDISLNGTLCVYMVLKNTTNEGITSADWSTSRVIDMGQENMVAVSGEYIRSHYTAENRKLENTVCYLGICMGMKYNSIKVPFKQMGARVVIGYTETVSIWYDNNMINFLTYRLTQTNEANTTRSYTIKESIDYAKSQVGTVDPAGWGAVMVTYGNDDVALVLPDNRATEIRFASSTFNVPINRISVIMVEILASGEEAHGFTQEWRSSDNNVLRVLGPRTVRGVSKGTALLTCKVSGNGYSFEKSCTVRVSEIAATSVEIKLEKTFASTGFIQEAACTVYPVEASGQNVTLYSTNEGCATVDGFKITAIAPGNTEIVAVTDSGVYSSVSLSVSSKSAYKRTEVIDESATYALFHRNGSSNTVVMSNNVSSSGYIASSSVTHEGNYITSSVSGSQMWKLIPQGNGFYIYNPATSKYLTLSSSNRATMTSAATSIFAFDSTKLGVINTTSNTNYLGYNRDSGFYFVSKSSGSSIYLYEYLNFDDNSRYTEISFQAHEGKLYKQTVKKGEHAATVTPLIRDGYTFLGWDKPLNNVTSAFTTNALYRSGETNMIVITFMHTNGTVIETQELYESEKIRAPKINDSNFVGWSEELGVATHNMTVFALYSGASGTPSLGDVNGDNKVNTGDSVMILKFAAEMLSFNSQQKSAADVNHDGNVNTGDAVMILKYAAGIITSF